MPYLNVYLNPCIIPSINHRQLTKLSFYKYVLNTPFDIIYYISFDISIFKGLSTCQFKDTYDFLLTFLLNGGDNTPSLQLSDVSY
jgi:hypothetical protein